MTKRLIINATHHGWATKLIFHLKLPKTAINSISLKKYSIYAHTHISQEINETILSLSHIQNDFNFQTFNVRKGTFVFPWTQKKYEDIWKRYMKEIFLFNCHLAAQQPTLGHCLEGSLNKPMLMIAFATYSTQWSLGTS